MKVFMRAARAIAPVFMVLFSTLIFAACDSGAPTSVSKGTVASGGKGCTRVGILLPGSSTSTRWESKDHPLLVQAITQAIPDVQIDYGNAQDNTDTQLKQAQDDLARGDCILVVSAHDSVAAAAIVARAKAQNVPVIAYDRLIQSKDTNYYVSFDGVAVGRLQGRYIADHYRDYAHGGAVNIAMINGSQTDNNAWLFSQGVHEVLDPLFANGSLKSVYETFTPDWNNPLAQTEMEVALSNEQNNIQVAYVANDGMAGDAIIALRSAHLNGKVLVTGQDATIDGIHNILTGDQSMTVYKPILKEAQSVGALVKALYNGADTNILTKGAMTATTDGGTIPTVLDEPVAVSINNIGSTVIADHFVTREDICKNIPLGVGGVC